MLLLLKLTCRRHRSATLHHPILKTVLYPPDISVKLHRPRFPVHLLPCYCPWPPVDIQAVVTVTKKIPAIQCTGNTAPDGIIRGLFPLDPSIKMWIRHCVERYDVAIDERPNSAALILHLQRTHVGPIHRPDLILDILLQSHSLTKLDVHAVWHGHSQYAVDTERDNLVLNDSRRSR